MKITSTKDPIIINGQEVNDPSEYLSADGMEVISDFNPITIDGDEINQPSDYLSADGEFMSEARGGRWRRRFRRRMRNRMRRLRNRMRKSPIRFLPPFAVARGVARTLNADGLSVDDFSPNSDFDDGNNFQMSSGSSGEDFYNAEGDNYYYIDKKNSSDVKAFQTYANSKGAKLVVDGIWGSKTQSAYDKFGAEWEASRTTAPSQAPSLGMSPPVAPPPTSTLPTIPQGQQPSVQQIEDAKKKGVFWDKAKGVWIQAKEIGAVDWLFGKLGLKTPATKDMGTPSAEGVVTKPKLSKGAKIGIYVGGALVVGALIYFLTKSNKK